MDKKISLENVLRVIVNRPPHFVFIALVYLVAVLLFKWHIRPNIDALFFVTGAVAGVYLMDFVEVFIRVYPSPFRTILFLCFFAAASFFVVSSSDSIFARGLVLTMHLMLVLQQLADWQEQGNLNTWYRILTVKVSLKMQQLIFGAFTVLGLLETYLFIR